MICPISCFGRILEEHVNERNAVVFLNPCHMKVDHRGLYRTMAKTLFYGLDILSIFQKMCCEGMAERVSGKLRVKTGTLQSFSKPQAYKMIVDWPVRTETFKYEIHARVTLAIGLQDNQRLARDRDNPVLAALAPFDVNHPPMDVYIGPLQVACFKSTKAAIVDCGNRALEYNSQE